MRLYCINNMYLSSIQQGIQSAHAAVDLIYKYTDGTDNLMASVCADWANNHKTMVVLNGGFSSELRSLLEILNRQLILPFCEFHEEDDALDGALTSVAIILPEYIYSTMRYIRENRISYDDFIVQRDWKPDFDGVDSNLFNDDVIVELMFKLNQYGLAK